MLEQSTSVKKMYSPDMARPEVRGLVCQECERGISPTAQFCPHCRAAILRRYCPGCRKLVPDSTNFCPYCGTSATDKVKHFRISYSTLLTVFASLSLVTLCFILIYRSGPAASSARTDPPTVPISPSVSVKASAKAVETRRAVQPPLNPSEGSRLNLVGHRLLKEGRYHDAINILRQAVMSFPEDSQDPSKVFALYNLGHSLRRTGKANEAIPLLMKCVQMDRQNPMFHEELQAARKAALRKPS